MLRIICDNTDEVSSIQPLAFKLANRGGNAVRDCNDPSIPRVLKLHCAACTVLYSTDELESVAAGQAGQIEREKSSYFVNYYCHLTHNYRQS